MTEPSPPAAADDDRLAQQFAVFVAMLQRGEPIDPEWIAQQAPEIREPLQEALQLARDTANPLVRRVPEIPGFQLLRPLGQGSSGTVWLALQQSLAREVALKVVHLDSLPSAAARERCLREARTLARIHDPRVVAVHDVIEHGQWLAIAMDHVQGPNLRTLLRALQSQKDQPPAAVAASLCGDDRKTFGPSWTQWVVRQGVRLARALAGLHQHDLVHRDVKPENVLLPRGGETVLADLGLARSTSDLATAGFSGTPWYAAPEQWRSEAAVDGRADVYSLGVLLYELLALSLPVDRSQKPASKPLPLPPLRQQGRHVSRDLAVVVHKALELDPDRRYACASAFADDLERVLHLQPILAAPPSVLGRSVRFLQRHNKGVLAAAAGVAIAFAALWPVVRALRLDLQAPRLAAEFADRARARLFEVIAQNGQRLRDQDLLTFDAMPTAAILRAAAEDYDSSLSHRHDDEIRRERDVALLTAGLLEARRGEFPRMFAAGVASKQPAEDAVVGKILLDAAVRWLSDVLPIANATTTQRIEDPITLRSLGLLACLLGDLRTCEDCWSRLDPMTKATPLVDLGLGILFAADGRPERALPRLLRSASECSDGSSIALRLADVAVRLGDTAIAERALARATATPTAGATAAAESERIRADLRLLAGDVVAARAGYEALLTANPDAIEPRARLAVLQLRAGEARAAVRSLRHLVEQHEGSAWLRLELARAALAAGDLGTYLQQARHAAARIEVRAQPSHGTLRSLAEILRLGGFLPLLAAESTRAELQPALGVADPTTGTALAARPDREAIAAVLVRLVTFDRGTWPTPRGREAALVDSLSILVRSMLAAPELLLRVDAHRGALTLLAAWQLHANRIELTRTHLPRLWLAAETLFASSSGWHCAHEHAEPFAGGGASLLHLHGKDGERRLTALTRATPSPTGTSFLRAVTPFGIAGHAQLRLQSIDATTLARRFDRQLDASAPLLGARATAMPDLDGDSFDDVVATGAGFGAHAGRAYAVSGRTGEVLWRVEVGEPGRTTPWALERIEDQDGDGCDDIAIGLPNHTHPLNPSVNLAVLSSRDGRSLRSRSGPALGSFGYALATVADLDGDGRRDLAVGCPHRQTGPGSVFVLAARDHATLRELRATCGATSFGRVLSTVADLDGDSIRDLAIGDASPALLSNAKSTVWVVSPATGRVLWSARSEVPGDGFGAAITSAPDVDADGIADLFIAAPNGGAGQCGNVTLHSGRDGRVLHTVRGPAVRSHLGQFLMAMAPSDSSVFALGENDAGNTRIFELHPLGYPSPSTSAGAPGNRTK